MRHSLAWAICAVALFATGTAKAAEPLSLATPVVMLGDEKTAPTPFVQLAQGPARSFWSDRNVVNCPDGLVVYQSTTEGRYGWAAGAACRVWLSDDLADALDADRFNRDELIDACQAITHEVGHALGLDHTPTGIMAESGQPPYRHAWAPWFCRGWSKRMVNRLIRENG